jgi:hypothetical protein
MERVERLYERGHRLERVGAQLDEPVVEALVVPELRGGHPGELRPVRQPRSHLGVLTQPLERRQLAVRDGTEQVDHRRQVDRVGEGDREVDRRS